MRGTNLLARIRALAERAAQGTLEAGEVLRHAADLEELRARLGRLAALGLADQVTLSPEVESLLGALAPTAVAA